jgi:hypothetical protein
MENSSRRRRQHCRNNSSRAMFRPLSRLLVLAIFLVVGMFDGSRLQGMLYTATAFRPLSVAYVCPERRRGRFAVTGAATTASWELSANGGSPWSCPRQKRPSPWSQLRSGHSRRSIPMAVTAASEMTNGEIHTNDETVSDFDSKWKCVVHKRCRDGEGREIQDSTC